MIKMFWYLIKINISWDDDKYVMWNLILSWYLCHTKKEYLEYWLVVCFGSWHDVVSSGPRQTRWLFGGCQIFSKVCPENRKHLSRPAVIVPFQAVQTLRSWFFSENDQFKFIFRAWVVEPLPDLIPVGIQLFDLMNSFETWITLRICPRFCTKQCAGAQFSLELWVLSHFKLAALCCIS